MSTLDIEQPAQLIAYLRRTKHIEANEMPTIRILAGGVSNRTVLVERDSGESWVLKQALAKLRVKVDWFSDPARIEREATALKWLPQLAPPGAITPLIFEDRENYLLAMAAVPKPHENWKTMLLAGHVDSNHVAQFAHLLAEIHQRSADRAEEFAKIFDDRSFFESLRIEPYYEYSAQQVPAAAAFYRSLIDRTRAARNAIVHGDYSPKNILVRERKLILLDHEVIHWGDGGFDIGFALAHLLSKAHHVPRHRDDFIQASLRFWNDYVAALRHAPPESSAHHTLGCLLARVAGRSQLEYLSEEEKRRQCDIVVALMQHPPAEVPEVIDRFARGL